MAENGGEHFSRRAVATALGAALLAPAAASTSLGSRTSSIYSLMDVLDRAERAALLSGEYDASVLTRMTALIQSLPEGAILDASMVSGDWLWGADPFLSIGIAPITLRLGAVTIKKNFNDGGIMLPSRMMLDCDGTSVEPTVKIEAIPNEANPTTGMIFTHQVGGTLSGASGQPTVTLDFAYNDRLLVGASLSIFGAVPMPEIELELSGGIDANDTTVTFTIDADDVAEGLAYFKVDDEVILGVVSGTTMTVQTRGANGTTAASHSSGAAAVLMIARIFKIVAKSGTLVTLDDNLPYSLTDARWRGGALDTSIRGGLQIDGKHNRADPAANIWCGLATNLSRGLRVEGDVRIANIVHCGVMLTGARDADITLDRIEHVGRPDPGLGSAIMLFGDNQRCTIRARSVDDGVLGVAFDSKSFGVTYFGLHQGSHFNQVFIDRLTNFPYSASFASSNNNYLHIGLSAAAGPNMDDSASQLTTPIDSVGNVVVIDHQTAALGPSGVSLALNRVSINGKQVAR